MAPIAESSTPTIGEQPQTTETAVSIGEVQPLKSKILDAIQNHIREAADGKTRDAYAYFTSFGMGPMDSFPEF